jgi:hypothetical protein
MVTNCPSCGSRSCKVFYEIRRVPTNNNLLASSRAEAIAVGRGDVILNFCNSCGFAFNSAFSPSLRAPGSGAGDSHHVSTLEGFQRILANRLVDRQASQGDQTRLTSCGGAEVLTFVCQLSGHHRIDDDRHVPTDLPAPPPVASVSEAVLSYPTDLICSSMVLMRVQNPARFLALVRVVLAERRKTSVAFKVYDLARTLKDIAFWNIQYQYCSYFSPGMLQRLLRAQGFKVSEIWSDRDSQHIIADTDADGISDLRTCENAETAADLTGLVARFEHECRERQAMWCDTLRRIGGAGHRIAIWGAGSRATSFLTTLAVGDEISYVIDANPCRQGKYTPGTGHAIVAPDVLSAMRPDVVIVMDAVLTFEIRDLLAKAGCAPTLLIA